MRTRQTFYTYKPGSKDWANGKKIVYVYEQPLKDVIVYYVMRAWYWLLDIKPISKRIDAWAKKRVQLPRDCGLEHDHAAEPDVCWCICPCVARDLDIWYYRNKNAVEESQ